MSPIRMSEFRQIVERALSVLSALCGEEPQWTDEPGCVIGGDSLRYIEADHDGSSALQMNCSYYDDLKEAVGEFVAAVALSRVEQVLYDSETKGDRNV